MDLPKTCPEELRQQLIARPECGAGGPSERPGEAHDISTRERSDRPWGAKAVRCQLQGKESMETQLFASVRSDRGSVAMSGLRGVSRDAATQL